MSDILYNVYISNDDLPTLIHKY